MFSIFMRFFLPEGIEFLQHFRQYAVPRRASLPARSLPNLTNLVFSPEILVFSRKTVYNIRLESGGGAKAFFCAMPQHDVTQS